MCLCRQVNKMISSKTPYQVRPIQNTMKMAQKQPSYLQPIKKAVVYSSKNSIKRV
jgi:hypothetical protein